MSHGYERPSSLRPDVWRSLLNAPGVDGPHSPRRDFASDIQQAAGELLVVSARLRRRACSPDELERVAAYSEALGELSRLSARVEAVAAAGERLGLIAGSNLSELRRMAAWLRELSQVCERGAVELRRAPPGGPKTAQKTPASPPDHQTTEA